MLGDQEPKERTSEAVARVPIAMPPSFVSCSFMTDSNGFAHFCFASLPTANAELPNAVFLEPIATELLFQEPV